MPRLCRECGADISARHHAAKLCAQCKAIKYPAPTTLPNKNCNECTKIFTPRKWNSVRCDECRNLINQSRSCATTPQIASGRIVSMAIKGGILPVLDGDISCQDCGNPAMDYDHRDYMKPLEVDPVCRRCNLARGPAINAMRSYTGKPIKLK